jgi:uroporphyrinogen III methyltransferase/synthase
MSEDHKVYLVGAGPGDPGLITVKGLALLQRADVVVYDFLANEKLLNERKEGAEVLCVGKRAGQHSMPQEEINDLLVELWRKGKSVVRLKGGDPFVFARGGEEALALADAKVPFEVVPGVTSGLAGLAYAGIPPTHRGVAVTATLATGHEDPAKGPPDLDLQALARCGGTIVIYMGVKNLSFIVKGLMKGGLPSDTPAALVYKATFPEQRVVRSTLEKIEADASAAGIRPPALLVVGRVVNLRERLDWFERLPLFGKRIVITRPREQSEKQKTALEALGAQVIEHPAINILPPSSFEKLDQAIERLDRFDIIVFTSRNGVQFFFDRLFEKGHDLRSLAPCRVAVIGPGTGEWLEAFGLKPDVMPPRYTSSALVPALVEHLGDVKGLRVLLPRADIAPDFLLKDLEAAGMVPEPIVAYRTVPAGEETDRLKKLIDEGAIDAVTFASSSSASSFIESLGAKFLKSRKGQMRFVSIGPVTSQTLNDLGFPPDLEAQKHTIPGLAQVLVDRLTRS